MWAIPPSKLCVTFSWQMCRQELSQQTELHGVPDTVLQPAYSTVHHYTSRCYYKHVELAHKTSIGVPSLIHWSHNWRQIHTKCQYNNLFQEKIRIIIVVLITQGTVKDIVRSRFIPQTLVVQTLDSIIHQINHYPVDKYLGNKLRYPPDRFLSSG